MKEKDMVSITCYGSTEKMERKKAIAFYEECAAGSEGSEQSRYINILIGLRMGFHSVSDEC